MRSLLYVPGNQERKLEKAFSLHADALILDLEDSVPSAEKARARQMVGEVVARTAGETSPAIAVRLNGAATGELELDLEACVRPGLDLVKATKILDARDVTRLDGALSLLERTREMAPGSVAILPEIDSAFGVLELRSIIEASPRVRRVQFGGGQDFAHDLGVEISPELEESQWAREYIVLMSRRCGLDAPIHGSVPGSLRDPERRTRVLRHASRLGYGGSTCIHPDQVAVTNEIFTPSSERIEHAKRQLAAFRQAERGGIGTAMLGGELVDEAHVRSAEALLRSVGALTQADALHEDNNGANVG